MKTYSLFRVVVALGLAALVAPFTVSAGNPVAEVDTGGKPVVEEPKYQLQPIFTRRAGIVDKVTLNTTVRGSRDVELQEADHFDSWGIDTDLVIPFFKRFQLRLSVPLYTEGEAELLAVPVTLKSGAIGIQKTGNVSMDGNGGVFDYGSVQLEGLILTEEQHGVNLLASFGYGQVLEPLQTNKVGRYNHAGEYYLFGLRVDRKVNDWLTLVGHAGMRHYFISDDINPAGQADGNVFNHYEAFLAGVFDPWKSNVFPVLEAVFTSDLDHYNSLLVVPEIIWAVNTHLELKAAVPVGIFEDGESIGFRIQATVRF